MSSISSWKDFYIFCHVQKFSSETYFGVFRFFQSHFQTVDLRSFNIFFTRFIFRNFLFHVYCHLQECFEKFVWSTFHFQKVSYTFKPSCYSLNKRFSHISVFSSNCNSNFSKFYSFQQVQVSLISSVANFRHLIQVLKRFILNLQYLLERALKNSALFRSKLKTSTFLGDSDIFSTLSNIQDIFFSRFLIFFSSYNTTKMIKDHADRI